MLFTMQNKFARRLTCSAGSFQDHGRTIEEAKGTLARVLENIESACSAAYGLVKENAGIMNLASGIDEYLFWEPVGAFLIVTPGNIPMHAWSSFVPYALPPAARWSSARAARTRLRRRWSTASRSRRAFPRASST